jgi:hypothetical protein
MKKNIFIFSLLIIVLFSSCKKEEDEAIIYPEGIRYKVTFDINWNSSDFPTEYPSNAHFSKLIGWSHPTNSTFFQVGTIASAGIQNMAEKGSTSPLDAEIKAKIEAGNGHQYVYGSGLGSGVGEISVEIIVNEENPAVTLASMIAPSPDWYIAVVNINLLENNAFVDTKTVDAPIYDSGTDDGLSYTSTDRASNPKVPISLFVDAPLGNGVALNATIAEVTFSKVIE